MEKEIRRKIDNAFYNYNNLKKISADKLVELAEKGIITKYGKIAVNSSGKGSLENQVCDIIDKQTESYLWCKVVENVLTKYHGEYKDKMIVLKFFKKNNVENTAFKLGISERTVVRWLDEIRIIAEMWAKEYKLI